MSQDIFQNKQKFFDSWAANYDCLFTTIFYQAIHQRLLEYLELPPKANILDLGCGTGRLLNRLATKFSDIKGTGLDLSSVMLKQARLHNQHRDRLIFVRGNAEDLPFTEGQFDSVFNTISFLHYPNPEKVLSEVNRVLSKGGKFYLVDTAINNEGNYLPFSPGGVKLYSAKKREELGLNSGLEIIGHYYLLGSVLLTIWQK